MGFADATIEVYCDEDGCTEHDYLQLPFVYRNMSPASGYYDHEDKTLIKLARKIGWRVDGDRHTCPSCAETQDAARSEPAERSDA